jgi:putative transposase
MRFHFVAQQRKVYPVALMCRLLGVSTAGFYDYLSRAERPDDPDRRQLLSWIKQLAQTSKHTYGSRRMSEGLRALGFAVGRDMARGLMQEAGIWVRYRKRFKVTTNSKHQHPLFDNRLKRQFDVTEPDRVWASDITYCWTGEGWLYLAVVIDLYSRKVVGWSMSRRMTSSLVCDALMMAIWRRRPQAGLIHHSDRGVQYASRAFRKLLKAHGILGSMSRKADCWDNAVVESFFGSLKSERLFWQHYPTRQAAQNDIVDYIAMFYNPLRLHSYLEYKSPDQYEWEAQWKKAS